MSTNYKCEEFAVHLSSKIDIINDLIYLNQSKHAFSILTLTVYFLTVEASGCLMSDLSLLQQPQLY